MVAVWWAGEVREWMRLERRNVGGVDYMGLLEVR